MLISAQERGEAVPSVASDLIERNVGEERSMKWIAGTLYAGGSDTVNGQGRRRVFFSLLDT